MLSSTFNLYTSEATLKGPWQVGSKNDKHWYIVNTYTGVSRKIGPVKSRGSNNFDKAKSIAATRNALLNNKE